MNRHITLRIWVELIRLVDQIEQVGHLHHDPSPVTDQTPALDLGAPERDGVWLRQKMQMRTREQWKAGDWRLESWKLGG